MQNIINKAKLIKCLICDVDGVLTDGTLYVDNNGHSIKAFHVHDGMGLKLLMASGIEIAIITTSTSQSIDYRMEELGIKHFFKGCQEKVSAFAQLKAQFGFQDHEFAYIGDDLPDLPIIKQVGFGVSVQNGINEVKEFAHFVTTKNGGNGAVREVCDFILYAQDKHASALEKYFKL